MQFKLPPMMTEEAINERRKQAYQLAGENPENISFWLPKIQSSTTNENSILKIPKTKIIPLDFETWNWLRSDHYTKEKVAEFNNYLLERLDNFLEGETLFMKTGIFSDKFTFFRTTVNDRAKIGEQFLEMYYSSLMLGPSNTNEAVFREMIQDIEGRKQIYHGMPLHTEFRVFFDFDNKKVVGVANYWHPEEMERYLREKDVEHYAVEKEKILADYEELKESVVKEVHKFMQGCTELHGKWSVDVMKNGEDFWLIDMARMEKSALVEQMESVE